MTVRWILALLPPLQHTRIHSHTWYTLFTIQWNPSHAHKHPQKSSTSHSRCVPPSHGEGSCSHGNVKRERWEEREAKRGENGVGCSLEPAKLRPTLVI